MKLLTAATKKLKKINLDIIHEIIKEKQRRNLKK